MCSPVTLVVAKCWDPNPKGYMMAPRQEPVRPIDPSAWVAHTEAVRAMYGQLGPPPSIAQTTRSGSLMNSIPECAREFIDISVIMCRMPQFGKHYIVSNATSVHLYQMPHRCICIKCHIEASVSNATSVHLYQLPRCICIKCHIGASVSNATSVHLYQMPHRCICIKCHIGASVSNATSVHLYQMPHRCICIKCHIGASVSNATSVHLYQMHHLCLCNVCTWLVHSFVINITLHQTATKIFSTCSTLKCRINLITCLTVWKLLLLEHAVFLKDETNIYCYLTSAS